MRRDVSMKESMTLPRTMKFAYGESFGDGGFFLAHQSVIFVNFPRFPVDSDSSMNILYLVEDCSSLSKVLYITWVTFPSRVMIPILIENMSAVPVVFAEFFNSIHVYRRMYIRSKKEDGA